MKISDLKTFHALGLTFHYGEFALVFAQRKTHPLLLAPSGPGLANLDKAREYREALAHADILLPDSGLLVSWQNIFSTQKAVRYSGYAFLKDLLKNAPASFLEKALWVMPDAETAHATERFLKEQNLPPSEMVVAPWYEETEIADPALREKVAASSPSAVIICIAGGKQEILGTYLKQHLTNPPPIYCLGAAIAFLNGQQAPVTPRWDKLRLGWLVRIFHRPSHFLPRYLKALRLLYLLARRYKISKPPEGV